MAFSAAAAPQSVAIGSAPSPADGTVRVGDIAPDFTLESFDGKGLRLGDYLGERPVLLIFWSYFCFPCQTELPQIAELQRQLGTDRLTVLGISLDGPQFSEKVRPFLAAQRITFPNLYDRESPDFFEVAERYGVVGTPTSFLLDSHGRVRFVHLGRLEPAVLAGVIEGAREHTFCAEITKPQKTQ